MKHPFLMDQIDQELEEQRKQEVLRSRLVDAGTNLEALPENVSVKEKTALDYIKTILLFPVKLLYYILLFLGLCVMLSSEPRQMLTDLLQSIF